MNLESYMLQQLAQLKYGHRDIIRGCYKIALANGYPPPPEGEDKFLDKIIDQLNSIDQNLKGYYENQTR